jgi:membrane carboxypeptidase/penicillin-binding protein
MKKLFIPFLALFIVIAPSCSTLKALFTAQDATAAIRELLSFGTEHGGNLLGKNGAFSKETLMQSVLPKDVDKVINVLETLGLGKEVNRFTTTLSTAAEKTVEKSVPIFLQGIKRMDIGDAFGIVKNGGTACTDYLRNKIGDTLRRAIAPEMNKALDEYKLAKQWNDLVAPAKLLLGDKLNLDLGNLMSGLVTNAMFAKIEEKEREIRTKAQARNTALLQKVFGQVLNKN